MADSNRVRGSIGGCEGEGGERGKRGKRGHRGHQGPIGPTGPAGGQFPDEFVSPPTAITIFVRPDGSNENDGSSPEQALATLAFAVTKVPFNIDAGIAYFIDITGVTETLPDGFILPAWKSPWTFGLNDFDNFGKKMILPGAVNIYSDPAITDRVPAADAVINASDGTLTQDDLTSGYTFTLNVARASWNADALKGAHLWNTVGGEASVDNMQPVVIHNSTTTTIQFLSPDTPVFPLLLMKPGATLTASNVGDFNAVISAFNVDSFSISNVTLKHGQFGAPGIFVDGSTSAIFVEFCDVDTPVFTNSCTNMTRLISSWVTGFPFLSSLGMGMFSVRNLYDACFNGFQCSPQFFTGADVYDGCTPVEPSDFFIDSFQPLLIGFKMDSCIVKNGMGDGVIFHGDMGIIFNTDIANNAGNGVTLNFGCGQMALAKVGSTIANQGDFGVSVTDGIQASVDVDTSTTLPGAGIGLRGAVNDANVGTAIGSPGPTPWATVAAPPNNVVDPQTFSRLSQF